MSLEKQIARLNPVKLERERFSLTPEVARKMLADKSEQWLYRPAKAFRKRTRADYKVKPKRRPVVLNLTEAQERAYQNYLEGLK